MANEVQGINCLFELNTGAGWLPFVCAKAFNLSLDTSTVETLGVGDGFWANPDYDFHSYNISLSGIMRIVDVAGVTAVDLLTLQMGFTEVLWRAVFNAPNGTVKVASGTAIITNSTMNVTAGSLVDTPVTLVGKGSFTLADTTAICASVIGAIVMGLGASANSRVFTLNGVTAGNLKIDYVIDGGATNSFFAFAPAATTIVIEISFTTGTHNITFTPVCQNGVGGTPFTLTGIVI